MTPKGMLVRVKANTDESMEVLGETSWCARYYVYGDEYIIIHLHDEWLDLEVTDSNRGPIRDLILDKDMAASSISLTPSESEAIRKETAVRRDSELSMFNFLTESIS